MNNTYGNIGHNPSSFYGVNSGAQVQQTLPSSNSTLKGCSSTKSTINGPIVGKNTIPSQATQQDSGGEKKMDSSSQCITADNASTSHVANAHANNFPLPGEGAADQYYNQYLSNGAYSATDHHSTHGYAYCPGNPGSTIPCPPEQFGVYPPPSLSYC